MSSAPVADTPPSSMHQPPAAPPPNPSPNPDLLRKAVVSLEKKLQERGAQLAEAQAARERLEAEQGRWVRGAAELEAATAEAAALRGELEGSQAELRKLRHHAVGLEDSCARLQEQVCRLEAENAQLASRLEQWRADREAAEVGCIRAQSAAAVQAAAVQQLEAANEALRLDAREHSAKLQQAYQREAELLAEIGRLKEVQRKRPPSPAPPGGPASPAKPGPNAGSSHSQELDSLHRDLFLAVAQHLLKEFSAKVAQAEDKAATLGSRQQATETKFGALASHSQALQTQLDHATEQCQREEQAVQALLASNLRLHEGMLQLMDQAAASAAAAAAAPPPSKPGRSRQYLRATQASLCKQQQQPQQQQQGMCAGPSTAAAPSEQPSSQALTPAKQGLRRQLTTAGETAAAAVAAGCALRPAKALTSSRQGGGGALGCEAAEVGPSSTGGGGSGASQCADAARAAAVEAALSIANEHRELYSYYKAVVAEEQRLRGCLAVGCGPSKAQQQLAQQHNELQRELWDVAEQLEAKVSQLTALKQAGLL